MDVNELRAEVERLGVEGRGRRFPPQLKSELVRAARRLRAGGARWTEIGDALGVTAESARRWCRDVPAEMPVVPVKVVEPKPAPSSGGLSVVTAGGARVDGLTLEQAAQMLRMLG